MLKLVSIIYLIVCLVYSALRYKKNRQDTWIRVIILLFFPVLGFLFLLILDIIHTHSKEKSDYLELESEILKHSEGLANIYLKVDVEKEINIVPMEEALLLNDTGTRRKMLINMLKDDSISHIGILETALQNSDTETAHYAATAVVELKRKLQLDLQEMSVRFEENKTDVQAVQSYAEVLKRYVESSFLDDRTKKKYLFTYSFVLEQLLELTKEEESTFIELINVLFENKEYPKAVTYCEMFHAHHPKSEMAYVMSLKLFYLMRDVTEFQKELLKMKQSPIRFSPQTLKLIRFWNEMVPKPSQSKKEEVEQALIEAAVAMSEGD